MSGEEKAIQLGSAVTEFQEAKTEIAHIDKKLETVFATYREVGSIMDRGRGTIEVPKMNGGNVSFGYLSSRIDTGKLLNILELTSLVQERDGAETRVKQAEQKLKDLGFTAFEPYSFRR